MWILLGGVLARVGANEDHSGDIIKLLYKTNLCTEEAAHLRDELVLFVRCIAVLDTVLRENLRVAKTLQGGHQNYSP